LIAVFEKRVAVKYFVKQGKFFADPEVELGKKKE